MKAVRLILSSEFSHAGHFSTPLFSSASAKVVIVLLPIPSCPVLARIGLGRSAYCVPLRQNNGWAASIRIPNAVPPEQEPRIELCARNPDWRGYGSEILCVN